MGGNDGRGSQGKDSLNPLNSTSSGNSKSMKSADVTGMDAYIHVQGRIICLVGVSRAIRIHSNFRQSIKRKSH